LVFYHFYSLSPFKLTNKLLVTLYCLAAFMMSVPRGRNISVVAR
jgi:hypothetical protein